MDICTGAVGVQQGFNVTLSSSFDSMLMAANPQDGSLYLLEIHKTKPPGTVLFLNRVVQ
jgi:hypothetical protein